MGNDPLSIPSNCCSSDENNVSDGVWVDPNAPPESASAMDLSGDSGMDFGGPNSAPPEDASMDLAPNAAPSMLAKPSGAWFGRKQRVRRGSATHAMNAPAAQQAVMAHAAQTAQNGVTLDGKRRSDDSAAAARDYQQPKKQALTLL